MTDERFNRWQVLAITQLSVAVTLVSALSVSGLGLGVALLQNTEFVPVGIFRVAFTASLFLLVVAAFCSCATVLSRLIDFRLTARKVRGKPPLKLLGVDPDPYSAATWRLFWAGCISFLVGATLLVASVGSTYALRFA